jgi:hypothetical protein
LSPASASDPVPAFVSEPGPPMSPRHTSLAENPPSLASIVTVTSSSKRP